LYFIAGKPLEINQQISMSLFYCWYLQHFSKKLIFWGAFVGKNPEYDRQIHELHVTVLIKLWRSFNLKFLKTVWLGRANSWRQSGSTSRSSNK
jgi:hypothetical protein